MFCDAVVYGCVFLVVVLILKRYGVFDRDPQDFPPP